VGGNERSAEIAWSQRFHKSIIEKGQGKCTVLVSKSEKKASQLNPMPSPMSRRAVCVLFSKGNLGAASDGDGIEGVSVQRKDEVEKEDVRLPHAYGRSFVLVSVV
jgi:hypothetical protein